MKSVFGIDSLKRRAWQVLAVVVDEKERRGMLNEGTRGIQAPDGINSGILAFVRFEDGGGAVHLFFSCLIHSSSYQKCPIFIGEHARVVTDSQGCQFVWKRALEEQMNSISGSD